MTRPVLRPASMPSRMRSSEPVTRYFPVVPLVLVALAVAARAADPAADLLAGRSKDCPKCNLASANLKRFDLSRGDLEGADLRGAILHRAQLAGANLAGANLTGA